MPPAIAAITLGIAGPAMSSPTALQVAAVDSPERVHGSDGREHIVYDLVITNSFTAEATLTSLVVMGGGKKLLQLRGDVLASAIRPFGGGGPTTRVGVSSSVVAFVDVVLPRSAGREAPERIRSRLSYTLPAGAPAEALIGSNTVNTRLRVDRQAPIVIAPPLRGPGWTSLNGCCDSASVPHRNTILSANGTYVAPETFSVDYVRLVDGHLYGGDGTQLADWFGYGVPVRSVASGRVVKTSTTGLRSRRSRPPTTTRR